MNRKAIVIGAPGNIKHTNYLVGVDIDLKHFINFLKSPLGGSWDEKEITGLYNSPSKNLIELFQNTRCDYLLVYFSGHGNHTMKETMIVINENEAISINQLFSLINAPKGLIIVDSCRKEIHEPFSNFTDKEFLSFNFSSSQSNSSYKYKEIISNCDNGISVMYGCSVGELCFETALGGAFTYSLLQTSIDWSLNQVDETVLTIETAKNISSQFINEILQFEQTPEIRTTNSSNQNLNFPFAIKTY